MKAFDVLIYTDLLPAMVALLGGWWLMILIGIAHNEWTDSIPAIGYWSAVKLAAVLCAGRILQRTRSRMRE